MILRRSSLPIVLMLMLGGSATAKPLPWKDWSSLRFRASAGALFRGHVAFRLERGERQRHLHTESQASFLGATISRSRTETVSDLESGRPREAWSHGKKRGRHYEFDDRGYTVRKLRPDGDGWEVALESRFDFEPPEGGDRTLHDYYGLLVDLHRTGLHAVGDRATVWVATSKGPREFRISVAEQRSQTRHIHGRETSLRELRLRFQPQGDDVDAGFLDMEGETEVWVEARSLTPVEISGKVPKVPGRVRLQLTEID